MTEEEPIIPPVDRSLIEEELQDRYLIQETNKGHNLIYVVSGNECPNTMREIGRLRELSFRTSGGGTGKSMDIDDLDGVEGGYLQLIVYNPEDREIIGGYRFMDCSQIPGVAVPGDYISTAHYFELSEEFLHDYLPFTIELGRSWVQPSYQPSVDARKGLFALANLWDGLGSLTINHPHIKYFFGKVTLYPSFNEKARDWLLSFMKYFFGDDEQLVVPILDLKFNYLHAQMEEVFQGMTALEAIPHLRRKLRELGESIPPLFNMYMSLSETMKCFGTARNPDFGDVHETGILIKIEDIHSDKKERHM